MIVSTTEPSPIHLPPLGRASRCFEADAMHLYLCTRLRGHSGRHAATVGHQRRVVDVWPDTYDVVAEPCS